MRKILLFPCLLFALSALCQAQPKSKELNKAATSNKSTKTSSQKSSPEKTKIKTTKRSNRKFTASKPTDHLLDLKHEPE